jgi:hypothetical protein
MVFVAAHMAGTSGSYRCGLTRKDDDGNDIGFIFDDSLVSKGAEDPDVTAANAENFARGMATLMEGLHRLRPPNADHASGGENSESGEGQHLGVD